MPIEIEAVGTVQPIAALQIKSRLDTQVAQVHVAEGASVKEGDLLFTLDDRVLKAQLAQIEAQILRTKAQLEQASATATAPSTSPAAMSAPRSPATTPSPTSRRSRRSSPPTRPIATASPPS